MWWGLAGKTGDENSSFWGLNKSGRDSMAAIPAYASWSKSKADESADRANESRTQGNQRGSESWDLWKNRANSGIGSTGDIRGYGQQAMPGVEDAVQNRLNLLAQQQQNLANFRGSPYGADSTVGQINSTLDTMGGNVGQNWDFNQGLIDQGYGGLSNRANQTSGDIVTNIKETYGSGRGQFNDAFNQMRGNAAGVFGGLEGSLNETTAAQQKNLEALNPASEASIARSARSYGPMMSNTMSRMRRGGVDPNSVQAGGVLAQAEAERARGMDDAAAVGAEKYALASNNVLSNKQAGLERLRGQGLAMDTSLGTNQAGTNLDLGLGEGQDFRNELTRNLGVQTGLDQNRMNQSLDNSIYNFEQGQNVLGQRIGAAQTGRTMGMQDLGLDQSFLDKSMAEQMVGPEALAAQWGLGQNYGSANASAQNTGISGMSQMAQADLARSIQESMLAQGFSQQAIDAQLKNLGIQSANAGWGSKAIIAGAQQAASAYAGGA